MTASALRQRLSRAIETFGDHCTVGSETRKALVSRLSAADVSAYLTDAEASTRPVFAALAAHDDPTAVDDAVIWASGTYTVVKTVESRYRGQVVARILIWR